MSKETPKTTAAFRCPVCGAGVLGAPGFFSVARVAGRVTLRCSDPDCPASSVKDDASLCMDLRVRASAGRESVDLSVPCIFCRRPHRFTADAALVSSRAEAGSPLIFTCPVSGVELAFFGEENRVKAELARSELELLEACSDADGESVPLPANDGCAAPLPDPEICEMINFVVRDLEAEGRLFCGCPPAADGSCTGNYEISQEPGFITVRCAVCGKSRAIPATSLIAAHDMLDLDSLTLE
jgi:hypothetical protein